MVYSMKIKDKRNSFEDRRHDIDIFGVSIKDNYGVTITDDRRNTPDRRINNIEVEWVEEDKIS
jgi:hypothetical protein